jgi:DHA1 family bicyclomycin/chloramphenicol resistance-like MFS transporter
MRLRPESVFFTLFLSALNGITPLSIDMGLPALTSIGQTLHVSPAAAGLTLSFFLTGFALGPIALGPISDRYGRRPVLLGSCALFAVAGVGCALAQRLEPLLIWRFCEGVGAGAGSTLSLAIVRDLFDGATARVRLSYVATVGTVAPMIAPTLGALVLAAAGWRSIYGCLAVAGVALILFISLGFDETLKHVDLHALRPGRLLKNYGRIFRSPICSGFALVGSLNFGNMFAYIASSPLVMIGVLGTSPLVYGGTFAATSLGIMAGAFTNGRLSARHVPARKLLAAGLNLSVACTLGLLLVSMSHFSHIYTLLPLLVLNTFSAGLIYPNANQGALHPVPDIAGVASAVLGSTRMLTGAFAGILVTVLFDGRTANAMALTMAIFSAGAWLAYWALVRPAERAHREV